MKRSNYTLSVIFTMILAAVFVMLSGMAVKKSDTLLKRQKGPCDIYGSVGTPCVAAHSTTRALYASYNGPLYQVMRETDGKTLDIGVVQPSGADDGGYADANAQDTFCANSLCVITKIYDQSGNENHLTQAPPGTFKGLSQGGFDYLPIADMAPASINGHKAYGVYIIPGMGLRNNNARSLAINDEPEGIYYVVDGKHFDSGCCFDYGNSSTNSRAVGTGTMETTYYGTSTAWGSGNGEGPWIMADMEAGLFSGYNAKKNDVPSITSWQFVSAFVNGGGGNKWELRGGDAQNGGLTTYYSGVRPGTPASNAYSPMNKKGGILLGNGGDNGNGSAGTFYEGVMTSGYPTTATTDAVQANVVAAKYNVQRVKASRLTTFAPLTSQNDTITFTNTTDAPLTNIKISIPAQKGWTAKAIDAVTTTKIFRGPLAPNSSVSATFKITSPATASAVFLPVNVEWTDFTTKKNHIETIRQRLRNAFPVKINEVRFGTGGNPTDQFIELYNASAKAVDISNWSVTSTPGGWSPFKLATIPAGTKIASHGFYVLGLATSGLAAPANIGDKTINVQTLSGLTNGQQISIDGEIHKIVNLGSAPGAMTTLYVPVSTSTRLNFPVGTTNLPVTSAAGFTVGEKIGIDMGGNYEIATVTRLGKAATQTNLAIEAKAGDNTIKVFDNASMTVGDELAINTGVRKELVKVKRIVNVVTAIGRAPKEMGEVELTAPLKLNHMVGVDVFGPGTGITFSPATHFAHKSGEAIQALGSGITLDGKLSKHHQAGGSIVSLQNSGTGYQGKPNQWYGIPLSAAAGSIALMNANNAVLIDGLVYGSKQSNSSANGTITSPEIATLEGDQSQGGCILVVPGAARGFTPSAGDQTNKSFGRYPDGYDADDNCHDFQSQNSSTLAIASTAGLNNIKVSSIMGFSAGQQIIVGSGNDKEVATIATVGTPGATTISKAVAAGTTVIPVNSAFGFTTGQEVVMDGQTVIITAVTINRRRPGNTDGASDAITINSPTKTAYDAGAVVAGSGITLTKPMTKDHSAGTQIINSLPTPGKPNQYTKAAR